MPPEGLEGRHDARGDLYSLGLTLYELLAFRPAFDDADRGRLLRRLATDAPPRLRALNPEVPRDLETVVHKAIDRDPAHRYRGADELAEDLLRFADDRPILARRASEAEKFLRWCRRNPAPAGLMATLVLVFWAAFGLVAWQWRLAVAEREAKEGQRLAARAAAERAGRSLYYSQIARARLEHQASNIAEAEAVLDRCDPLRRGWEWHYLKALNHPELLALGDRDGWVARVAYSPDGRLIATAEGGEPETRRERTDAARPGRVNLWDAATGRLLRTFRDHGHLVANVAFSPDSRTLASAGYDGTARLYDVATGRPLRTIAGGNRPVDGPDAAVGRLPLAFSPDGARLATGREDGTLAFWDVRTGALVAALPAEPFGYDLATFSPDGRWLATASSRDRLGRERLARLWDATRYTPAAALEHS